MITHGRNANVADWSLEFDERMGAVVEIRWARFTVGAKIGIVADGALVSVTLNVRLTAIASIAKRSVTVDAVVTSLAGECAGQRCDVIKRFVERDESVAWVDEGGIWKASSTEIPIGAIEALVADSVDILGEC